MLHRSPEHDSGVRHFAATSKLALPIGDDTGPTIEMHRTLTFKGSSSVGWNALKIQEWSAADDLIRLHGDDVRQQAPILRSTPFQVTNRQVLTAFPIMLTSITTPLVGLTETIVVGRLGGAALLGGLAAGVVALDVIFVTFNFLRSGTCGLVAQCFGRADLLEERAVFLRAFLIATVFGLILGSVPN